MTLNGNRITVTLTPNSIKHGVADKITRLISFGCPLGYHNTFRF
ncbi:hypothetical protein VCHA50O413_80157 [Vibrio chagasii]|nr:hypothetical protein VCHA36P164_110040 [Vibrio chagasii]CAH6956224.1 hypothetical protein VCHA50O404_100157 [Vibrio chagasii]CAH6989613.1 hypothetical protein VCHA51O444_120054 [Vibrio chagasii]CAH7115741.1 hypothetical protein VCHA50O384_100034 [Vibrio chagasii]CAH7206558.1 hypothetical protein VCHA37P203_160100 [Vibrio chagasii]